MSPDDRDLMKRRDVALALDGIRELRRQTKEVRALESGRLEFRDSLAREQRLDAVSRAPYEVLDGDAPPTRFVADGPEPTPEELNAVDVERAEDDAELRREIAACDGNPKCTGRCCR